MAVGAVGLANPKSNCLGSSRTQVAQAREARDKSQGVRAPFSLHLKEDFSDRFFERPTSRHVSSGTESYVQPVLFERPIAVEVVRPC